MTTAGHLVVVIDPDRLARRGDVPGRVGLRAPARRTRVARRRSPRPRAGLRRRRRDRRGAPRRLRRSPSTTATTATLSDVTMQPLTEQLAGCGPGRRRRRRGRRTCSCPRAGYLGLIPRIVLTAESQDQYHAQDRGHARTARTATRSPRASAAARRRAARRAPRPRSGAATSPSGCGRHAGIDTTGIDGASKTFVTWGRARDQFLPGINATPAVGDAVVWGVLNPLWGAHVGHRGRREGQGDRRRLGQLGRRCPTRARCGTRGTSCPRPRPPRATPSSGT